MATPIASLNHVGCNVCGAPASSIETDLHESHRVCIDCGTVLDESMLTESTDLGVSTAASTRIQLQTIDSTAEIRHRLGEVTRSYESQDYNAKQRKFALNHLKQTCLLLQVHDLQQNAQTLFLEAMDLIKPPIRWGTPARLLGIACVVLLSRNRGAEYSIRMNLATVAQSVGFEMSLIASYMYLLRRALLTHAQETGIPCAYENTPMDPEEQLLPWVIQILEMLSDLQSPVIQSLPEAYLDPNLVHSIRRRAQLLIKLNSSVLVTQGQPESGSLAVVLIARTAVENRRFSPRRYAEAFGIPASTTTIRYYALQSTLLQCAKVLPWHKDIHSRNAIYFFDQILDLIELGILSKPGTNATTSYKKKEQRKLEFKSRIQRAVARLKEAHLYPTDNPASPVEIFEDLHDECLYEVDLVIESLLLSGSSPQQLETYTAKDLFALAESINYREIDGVSLHVDETKSNIVETTSITLAEQQAYIPYTVSNQATPLQPHTNSEIATRFNVLYKVNQWDG
jgi:hypothetical protein